MGLFSSTPAVPLESVLLPGERVIGTPPTSLHCDGNRATPNIVVTSLGIRHLVGKKWLLYDYKGMSSYRSGPYHNEYGSPCVEFSYGGHHYLALSNATDLADMISEARR
jgi:hypothetical protein